MDESKTNILLFNLKFCYIKNFFRNLSKFCFGFCKIHINCIKAERDQGFHIRGKKNKSILKKVEIHLTNYGNKMNIARRKKMNVAM